MNERLFRGLGTALVTPFRGGDVDWAAYDNLIERQIAAGTEALIVCGTTGEPAALTARERDALIRRAVEVCNGRCAVVAGTGANDTSRAIELSRQAQAAGADALLLVTPYYNKTTQAGLIAHYTAVAGSVDLPMILYNVPSRTGLNLLPETAAALCRHGNICGIKEASGNISQIAELARLCGDEIALYSGSDDQTLAVLALGGQGVISVAGNVCPELMREITARWFASDMAGSRVRQLSLLPLIGALFAEVNPIPVKAALSILALCEADVRLPLVPATKLCRARLIDAMRALALIPR